MKRTLLIAALIFAACAVAPAQRTRAGTSADASSRTSARAGDALQIDAGTRLAAQLQQALDVRKARVGDEVVLKTTEAIKSQGRTVVAKGARLVGRVTDVKERARGSAYSSIGLVFDRLESGSLATPITATITSITQANASAQTRDEDASAGARTTSGASGGGTSSGGGLLGGVSNTVGGVVDTTTNAAGQAVGATTGAVGGAANGVGGISGLRITQSTDADVSGGATLSLLGGNLRLEKNATFHLVINESAGVNDRH